MKTVKNKLSKPNILETSFAFYVICFSTKIVIFFFVFSQHYDGDIRDLELTFSFDEDVLGKVGINFFL